MKTARAKPCGVTLRCSDQDEDMRCILLPSVGSTHVGSANMSPGRTMGGMTKPLPVQRCVRLV